MATLDQFREFLVSDLGFKAHQINDGDGSGVATTVEVLDEKAAFLVSTSVGNCYAAIKETILADRKTVTATLLKQMLQERRSAYRASTRG